MVASLIVAYGNPADRLIVFVKNSHRGEQFVWGLSSSELRRIAAKLTDVSGPKHWHVEAIISEPSTEHIVVFVQSNAIEAAASDAAAGGGQIKF